MTGARGDDLSDFYDAGLGPTRSLDVSAVSAHTPDEQGPLPPGRHLIQVTDPGGTDIVWMKLVPFVAGETPATSAAVPAFPFVVAEAIEVNIRPGHNDRIVAITSGGTATLYATQVSRIPAPRPRV